MSLLENNYAFIDSQNLNLSVEKDQGWKLDWAKFRIYLKHTHKVNKAYLFIGYVATNQDLYTNLQSQGYVLIFKPTMIVSGKPKGNVDAELVLHTVLEMPNYDKAVIVSGDGDYLCLIKHLKKVGKLKGIVIPNRNSYSSLLKGYTSYMSYVTDLRHKLEYKK